jgi:hypothetical protein
MEAPNANREGPKTPREKTYSRVHDEDSYAMKLSQGQSNYSSVLMLGVLSSLGVQNRVPKKYKGSWCCKGVLFGAD